MLKMFNCEIILYMPENLSDEKLVGMCPHGNFPASCQECAKNDIKAPEYFDNPEYKKLYEKRHQEVEKLTNEITKVAPELNNDLPKLAKLPPYYIDYPQDWNELDNAQKSYEYTKYMNEVRLQLQQIEKQVNNLKNFRSIDDGKPFTGTAVECANFWAAVNPTLRKHLYDIIKPRIPETKTVTRTVRHSIDYTVAMRDVGWKERLSYLAKYPGYREESCYSQGEPPGEVVLEVEAKVRKAYPMDVGSAVNPYTGEKVYSDRDKYNTDPVAYFANKPKYIKELHSHSDELFSRFDIHKDLKKVIVRDTKLIPQVRDILSKYNIEVPIEFEAGSFSTD